MGNSVNLRSVDPDSVSNLPGKGILKRCRVCSVHDGDTITIIYMIGRNVPFKTNLRLEHIDAPEITSKNQLEKEAGCAVSNWLNFRLSRQKYWWVMIKGWDKYGGRIIGTLYSRPKLTSTSINAEILDKGFAIEYSGGKKKMWSKKALEEIVISTQYPHFYE